MFSKNVLMNLTYKLNLMLMGLSDKVFPFSISFPFKGMFKTRKNQLLVIICQMFKANLEYLMTSFERLSNFIIMSYMFLKSTNTKEIRYEDLQLIASFYERLILASYNIHFQTNKTFRCSLMNRDNVFWAMDVARANILENFIILQIQKDIKINNFDQKLSNLWFSTLKKDEIVEESKEAQALRSNGDMKKSAKVDCVEKELSVSRGNFEKIFDDLTKKFHKDNAYHSIFSQFKKKVFRLN